MPAPREFRVRLVKGVGRGGGGRGEKQMNLLFESANSGRGWKNRLLSNWFRQAKSIRFLHWAHFQIIRELKSFSILRHCGLFPDLVCPKVRLKILQASSSFH